MARVDPSATLRSTEPAEGEQVANDAAADGPRPGRGSSRFAPLVLCYHAVSETWDNKLSVNPAALRSQLTRLINSGYESATVADSARGGGKMLHVTFDDAYRSVRRALAICEELGIRATVFTCSDFADSGAVVSVPELRQEAACNPQELETLTWDELRELSERGVEIGSHTVTHPHLTATTDNELEWELVESKRRIEAAIGRPCRFLAYPYGEHDLRVRQAAQAAGYEGAFALPLGTEWGDLFQIGRVGIYRFDTRFWFGVKTMRFFRGRLGARLVTPRNATAKLLSTFS